MESTLFFYIKFHDFSCLFSQAFHKICLVIYPKMYRDTLVTFLALSSFQYAICGIAIIPL